MRTKQEYQEALDELIEFDYNPMFDCRDEYLGYLSILKELIDNLKEEQ